MAELLAPAGNLERLKWAAAYGADAVYFGVSDYSLRSYAGNFSIREAAEGLEYLHKRGRKGYVTLNIYPFSDEYGGLLQTAAELQDMGADAFIVADIGVLFELKKAGISTPIHISTQANTTSYQSVLAYGQLGAKRINLARELSLAQIEEIQQNLARSSVETEVFVHGSVCFSYSGRCAISDYLTGRMANRGECTHPCRWNYTLMEEKRPGEYMPIFEDERGLYLFNSRDLALFAYLPELVQMGVDSFKIEGRMKNVHYIAAVLSVYRRILDGQSMEPEDALLQLGRVNNRGFSQGFIKGGIDGADYEILTDKYRASSVMLAASTKKTVEGMRVVKVKNTINAGETVEMLTPGGISEYTLPKQFRILDKEPADRANNQDTLLLPPEIPPYAILRRIANGK